MINEIEKDNLEEIVNQNDTVIVQYSTGWCGNCRLMKPKFKKFSGDFEDAKFYIVDAEKNPDSRALANVNHLPTFAAFKNGKLTKQLQTNKAEVLKEFLDEVTSN